MVLDGFKLVDDIEAVGSNEGTPQVQVTIQASGELPSLLFEEEWHFWKMTELDESSYGNGHIMTSDIRSSFPQ